MRDEEFIEAEICALKAELRTHEYRKEREEIQQKASQYKEGRSADHPRTASTSPDEYPLFRRGRRRNSSFARERTSPVQSNNPAIYCNAPILSESPISIDSHSIQEIAPSPHDRQNRRIIIVSPPRSLSPSSVRSYSSRLRTPVRPKGILREPRARFPKDLNPIREGIAFARSAGGRGQMSSYARRTKIDRRLVNLEALDAGKERYQERPDYVVVLRVLTKEEIELYALKKWEIRGRLLFKLIFEGFD